jgi:hypothetical protein
MLVSQQWKASLYFRCNRLALHYARPMLAQRHGLYDYRALQSQERLGYQPHYQIDSQGKLHCSPASTSSGGDSGVLHAP